MDETSLQQWLDFIFEIGGISYIAKMNGKVVGYIECLRCNEPEPYGKYFFINVIQVKKELRGHGIGTALTKHVIQEAFKLGFNKIDTQPSGNYVHVCKKLGMNTFKVYYEVYRDIVGFEELPVSGRAFNVCEQSPLSDLYKSYYLIFNHILPSNYVWLKLYGNVNRIHSTIPPLRITLNDVYQFVTAMFIEPLETSTVDLYLFTNTRFVPKDHFRNAVIILLNELYKRGIRRVKTRCENDHLKLLTNLNFKKTGMEYEYMRLYKEAT
jgi:GNAT superfamily N-acetyltransferase